MIEIVPNIHPVFVHFSVALVLTSLALYVASFFMTAGGCKQQVELIARWNLWFGAIACVFTVAAGVHAFNTVTHDTPSHKVMLEHRGWALWTLAAVLSVAGWAWLLKRKEKQTDLLFVSAFLLAGGLMMTTAWYGGELVYRHGLGVLSLPDAGNHDHSSHAHGNNASSEAHSHDHDSHDEAGDHHDDHKGGYDDHHVEPAGDASHHHESEAPSSNIHIHADGSSHVH